MSAEIPDDVSLPTRHNFLHGTTSQKHYPDLGSDESSVWNFCKRLSDVTQFKGKQAMVSRNIGY